MSERQRNAETGDASPSDVGVADTVFSTKSMAVNPEADNRESLVGHVVANRYKFLQLLGAGGMGAVYLARDHELDELVAVKMLRESVASSPDAIDLLRHEVRLARRVTHRNVARIFELGEDDGRRFVTMEYIDGESVAALIRERGRLPLRRVAEILIAVCRGLEAVHEAGVVHSDIKPDNVLVARNGRVVISDFGIARASRSSLGDAVSATRAGTPAYMAPEQVLGQDVTTRSDVYALGVMAFEMFSGALPWIGSQHEMDRRVHAAPPDARAVAADVPDAIAHLLMRSMAPQPNDRVASPSMFAQELSSVITQVAGTGEWAVSLLSASRPTSSSQRAASKLALAVLPFDNRGSSDDDYLASGITEDLIDCLSGVSEFRVLSRGATARFAADAREAHEIARELGVDVVIEGSLQRVREAIQIKARAIESSEGVQRWSKRYQVSAEDLLTTSDEIADAIIAALARKPAELEPSARPSALPNAVAMELYLRARESYRMFKSPSETSKLFQEALRLAPESPMVHAGYAMSVLRVWMLQSMGMDSTKDLGLDRAIPDIARAAAERANELAPHLGEPHMALALLSLHQGDPVGAVRELRTTIALAPSMALAHAFLGELLAEIARVPEAMRRLDTATLLDPTSALPNHARRRTAALLGDWDLAYKLRKHTPAPETPLGWSLTLRVAAYRGDREFLAHIREQMQHILGDPYNMAAAVLGQVDVYLGRISGRDIYHLLRPADTITAPSRRGRANRFQVLAEIASFSGDIETAQDAIAEAVDLGFVDLLWLDNCPLLEPLRDTARFGELRARMQERVHAAYDALWT